MSRAIVQPTTTKIFARSTAKLLHRTTCLMDKAVDRALQDSVGVSLSQFLMLMQLDGGQQCQRELASELGVTPAAISRQVSMMVARGWIKKLEHDHDRRFEFLVLTTKGKRLYMRSVGAIEEVFAARYGDLDEQEQHAIYQSLAKLAQCYEGERSS
ncbi:winged helix-turn-helix transcriptional regulator [bacterium]|nr:winged helix-turn-helix transcriptional regulator [bacterium]